MDEKKRSRRRLEFRDWEEWYETPTTEVVQQLEDILEDLDEQAQACLKEFREAWRNGLSATGRRAMPQLQDGLSDLDCVKLRVIKELVLADDLPQARYPNALLELLRLRELALDLRREEALQKLREARGEE
jgi:hypothetical protein